MELFAANRQWSNRPADERFWTVTEAYEACKHYADTAREVLVPATGLPVVRMADENIGLQLNTKTRASLTNYAFSQLCKRAGAPTDYIAKLSTTTAVACLDEGLAKYEAPEGQEGKQAKLLVHENGRIVARAITSEGYSRVWNWQVFDKLRAVEANGWRVAPARPNGAPGMKTRKATAADVVQGGSGVSVKVGDTIAPAGLYASDHDMFAFLVNEERNIDDGSDGGLNRGFFVSNSEVGAGSLKITYFLYRNVCGNHIVWGAKDVVDVNIRHVGEAWGRFEADVMPRLKDYADQGARDDESRIRKAMKFSMGKTADEVLDTVFGLLPRRNGLPSGMNKKIILSAITEGEKLEAVDGSPYTLWGFTNSLTRLSQATPFADRRTFLDRFAGELVNLALAG